MNVSVVILVGAIMLASLFWQGFIFGKDRNGYGYRYRRGYPRRLVVPFFSGAIVVLGVFIYGIIAIIAGHVQDIGGFWPWIGRVFLAIFFALFLILKAYLSAIVVGYVASSFCYSLLLHGEMQTVPILGSLFNLVFPQSPQWLHTLYIFMVCIYGLVVSLGDSFEWDWENIFNR